MSLKSIVFPAALALLAGAPAVRAQSYSDPGAGVGVHAAYTKSRGAEDGFFSGGAQVRFRLTGGLGLEVLASYRKDEYASAAGERVLKVEQVPVQGSLQLFFLTSTPIQPYVVAGGGYYYIRTTGLGSNEPAGKNTENKFGLHAGFGLDLRVARKMSLHGDVRYVFLDVDAVKALNTNVKSDFWHGTAGVTFYF